MNSDCDFMYDPNFMLSSSLCVPCPSGTYSEVMGSGVMDYGDDGDDGSFGAHYSKVDWDGG